MDNKNKEERTARRIKCSHQSVVTSTYFQLPQFLFSDEFPEISNNAIVLYTLMLDRHRLSIKNDWFDENGDAYIYFKREEMEKKLRLSERTVKKIVEELISLNLIEEKKQGLNKPNKIYLLFPVIDGTRGFDNHYDSEPVNTEVTDTQNLRPQTRKIYDSEPVNIDTPQGVNSTVQVPQDLSPNKNYINNNEFNNNEKRNNYMNNTEFSQIAASNRAAPPVAKAAAEPDPTTQQSCFSQIIEMYNSLSTAKGLRCIKSISGKRKADVSARLKEYGIQGFTDLFQRVSESLFLCGGGERGWKADFDWLIAQDNMQKVLEGKYDDGESNTASVQQPIVIESNTTQTGQRRFNNERHDPFLERAMSAYANAVNQSN